MKKALVIFSLIAGSVVMVKCSPKAAKSTTASTTTATKPAATSDQVAAGKVIYNNNCGKCHGLKDPTQYTKDSWNHILQEMIPKAKLNPADGGLVTDYVMANAKQG
jgi:mono/diheme cytochrome c family protein